MFGPLNQETSPSEAQTMNRRTHRKLGFQQLENRLTMAGNVIASVASHSLYLTGDSRANNLEIIQVGNGQYQVTGKDGTTINGQPQKTFSGVTADLIVNLNGGNDTLKIGYYAENVTVPTTIFNRDVKVNLGSGDDQLYIYHTNINDDVTINAGSGADQVYLRYSRVGFANMDSGINDCTINMGNNPAAGHQDFVDIRQTSFGHDLTITSAGSAPAIDSTHFLDTQIYMDSVYVVRNMTIQTGNGEDLLEIESADVNGLMKVLTGGGDDDFDLFYTFADDLTIGLGDGNDNLYLTGVASHQASFDGGAGSNDRFTVQEGFYSSFGNWTLTGFDHQIKPMDPSLVEAVVANGGLLAM
jgi:hypothetical protein